MSVHRGAVPCIPFLNFFFDFLRQGAWVHKSPHLILATGQVTPHSPQNQMKLYKLYGSEKGKLNTAGCMCQLHSTQLIRNLTQGLDRLMRVVVSVRYNF